MITLRTPSYLIRMEPQQDHWYHGKISREEAERILRDQGNRDGAFLVRESNTSEGDYVLSVLFQNNVTHYQIRRHQDDSFFSIEEKSSPIHGLDQLIEHYRHYQGRLVTTLSIIVRNSPPPQNDLLNGKTNLLHRVINGGDVNLLQNVINDRTRNLEAKNEVGRTACHIACIQGKDDVIATLLQKPVNLRTRDVDGNTPLHYACRTCSRDTIKRLIEAGADIQARNIKNGHVPLHEAAKYGNLNAVQLLLDYNIPHMPRTEIGQLPVDLARDAGHDSVVNYLDEFEMLPAKTSKSHWFHGTLTRQEAVNKLKEKLFEIEKNNRIHNVEIHPYQTGIFLVRSSDTMDNRNKISLLYENSVKHFVINETIINRQMYYYIDQGPYLPSLEHLIEHYQRYADGLPTNLRYNVVPPKRPEVDVRTLPKSKHGTPMRTPPQQQHTNKTVHTQPLPPESSPSPNKTTKSIKNQFRSLFRKSTDSKNEAKTSNKNDAIDSLPIEFTSVIQADSMLYQEPPKEPRRIDAMHYTTDDTQIQHNNDPNANHHYQNAQISIIPNRKLALCERLGEGEFGCVYRGTYDYGNGKHQVAIKTLNPLNHGESDRKAFLHEAELMMNLHHPCIVKLIGISEEDPLMMVQELVPLGAMLNYLQINADNITNIELKYLAVQIASGMDYLVSKHFVHRDLAARNILLQSRVLAKITDFGLSRCFSKDKNYYAAQEGGKWPVKWYAPESYHHGKFSHASDVWSFGITLWEMFSRGDVPYGEVSGAVAIDIIESGERLHRPENCPIEVYQVMLNCWEREPSRRPTFSYLINFFQNLYTENIYSHGPNDNLQMSYRETEYMTINDLSMSLPKDKNFNQPQSRQPLVEVDNFLSDDNSSNYIVNSKEIVLHNELGTGVYGNVFKGEWKETEIALKQIIPSYNFDRKEFMRELSKMIELRHSSIVRLLAFTLDHQTGILMEFMPMSSALCFLQSHNTKSQNPVTREEMSVWAYQIADGMNYIHNRGIIHGNLGARNVMLQTRNQAKISDFGLAKILTFNHEYYKPLEYENLLYWSAIENFQDSPNYTTASDAWSFGVTLWEIFSYGARPYENMNTNEMMMFVKSGKRLQCPKTCTPAIYNQILKCWDCDPLDRPSFLDLLQFFTELENKFEESDEYLCTSDVDQDRLNANTTISPATSGTNIDKIIDIADVTKEQILGGGEFGTVYAGSLYLPQKKTKIPVAIKTLNIEKAEQFRNAFLQEFSIMVNLKHPSIIKLIGIVTGPPLMIVQELATDCLLQYLHTNKEKISPEIELKLWAYQIASGMNYLVSKRFVHRDLAARNILLQTKMQAKISDFGLSRVFNSENEYQASQGGLWPFKWYAPESFLYGRFSHASDVWSFGVFLWELFSFGESPYGDMGNEEYAEKIDHGYRLPKPRACPQHVYNIMIRCWLQEPRERPKFSDLMDFFAKDYLYENIHDVIFKPQTTETLSELNNSPLVPNIVNV